MGIPTYEYPPSTYPMAVKYTDKGQCTQCGYKWIYKNDNFTCKICNTKMHGGVEVNDNVYFHGDTTVVSNRMTESNDSIREQLTIKYKKKQKINLISIYVYPPKKFPMKAVYFKRNGVCVHCKNKVLNSHKSVQCSKCKIEFCGGVDLKNIVYYHGRRRIDSMMDDYNNNNNNNSSSVIDMSLMLDTDSSVNFSKKFSQSKICFFSLLVLIFIICILIIIFVYLLKRSV
jgi:hypothetical protein